MQEVCSGLLVVQMNLKQWFSMGRWYENSTGVKKIGGFPVDVFLSDLKIPVVAHSEKWAGSFVIVKGSFSDGN